MKKIITISREFGAGGGEIGRKVAERLGYHYYDKELIKAVAEKTGFDPKFIEERGEYAPGRTIFSMLTRSLLRGPMALRSSDRKHLPALGW